MTYAKHEAKKTLNPDERELIRWLSAWRPDTTPNRLPLAPTGKKMTKARADDTDEA